MADHGRQREIAAVGLIAAIRFGIGPIAPDKPRGHMGALAVDIGKARVRAAMRLRQKQLRGALGRGGRRQGLGAPRAARPTADMNGEGGQQRDASQKPGIAYGLRQTRREGGRSQKKCGSRRHRQSGEHEPLMLHKHIPPFRIRPLDTPENGRNAGTGWAVR